MKKIFAEFFQKEFFVFILIGGVNTLSGVLFSSLFSIYLNANVSFILGYICGLIISYILNSKVNFKQQLSIKRFVKFSISYFPNFIIQNVIVILFYNILNIHKIITYAIAAFIGIPVTYLFVKIFAFDRRPPI